MKRLYYILPLLLMLAYLAGPRPQFDDWKESELKIKSSTLPLNLIESRIKDENADSLKNNNESRIIWADSMQKTEYSLVYLHGFSASPMEGEPIVSEFAKRYGMNVYMPLLPGHGLDDKESFVELGPKDLIMAARRAITVGTAIGEKVIVMSCSTGSTLGLYFGAYNDEKIHAQIMYSPNVDIRDKRSRILMSPWGMKLANYLNGSPYRKLDMPPNCNEYWTMEYRLEGLAAVRSLLNNTMKKEYFEDITHPVFVGYYYKNEDEKDQAVSIPAIKKMFKNLDTPADKKRLIAFEDGAHVLPSNLQNDNWKSVQAETYKFAEEVLGLQPR